MPGYFIRPDAGADLTAARIGGKGANLAALGAAGQPVPPWYAVTTACMEAVFAGAGLDRHVAAVLGALAVDADAEAIEHATVALRDAIARLELPAGILAELQRLHAAVIPAGRLFSVRSSAVDEDAGGASFAGLHDSFLFVHDTDALVDRMKRVWASAFNTRAIAFRLKSRIPLDRIRIAVVVQEMVTARASGVMFTANPNTGNVQEIVISSLWGAGEGIVSTGLDADLFAWGKKTGTCTVKLAVKTEQLLFDRDRGHGLKRVPIPAAQQTEASLTVAQVRELAGMGAAIEQQFERPQDIEFSVDEAGKVFVLQARPVTTVPEYGPAAGNPLVWDNSNIIESYSGPTSPMTFSFIRHAYTIVYHCFAEVMGIPPAAVRRDRYVFENMLGLFRGQVYYNIINWYRLVKLFPGFEYNKAFMESMMGLREKIAVIEAEAAPPASFGRRYFVELPKLLALLARSAWNFACIERLVREFDEHFKHHYGQWAALDFDRLPPHELMRIYRDMEEALLWNWKTPIINDFYVMIFYGSLKRRCAAWCNDRDGNLQNDLICGEGDIESTRPTKLLMDVARQVRANPALLQAFTAGTPEELAARVPRDPLFAEIAPKLVFYLREYGFRCINELKLEEPSLRDTPQFLYQMIQNYLKMEDVEALDPAVMEARERRIRADAEARAEAELRRTFSFFPRRFVFRRVLRNARRGVKNRENMRFARTRIYGLLRELLNAMGRRFEREGLLQHGHDIYYLTIDEVWDFIKGTAVTANLRGLVELRKAEFAVYNAEARSGKLDDHFETYGMAYHRNLFKNWKAAGAGDEGGGLRGIGCCPGRVTARIKIVHSPRDDLKLNGEILVTARTDPGWVPLYPAVSGILVERGSILSHSAIVAREMGIPTIVGIPDLLATLKDGQTVAMDGATGEVTVPPQ